MQDGNVSPSLLTHQQISEVVFISYIVVICVQKQQTTIRLPSPRGVWTWVYYIFLILSKNLYDLYISFRPEATSAEQNPSSPHQVIALIFSHINLRKISRVQYINSKCEKCSVLLSVSFYLERCKLRYIFPTKSQLCG